MDSSPETGVCVSVEAGGGMAFLIWQRQMPLGLVGLSLLLGHCTVDVSCCGLSSVVYFWAFPSSEPRNLKAVVLEEEGEGE